MDNGRVIVDGACYSYLVLQSKGVFIEHKERFLVLN